MADTVLLDPLGRSIVLSDATWYGHILKGHPDMAGARPHAEQTVGSPEAIHLSASDGECRLYYSPPGQPTGPARMICVVANIQQGFVKTAYFCKRIKPGAREWPLQKPSRA